MCKFEVVNNDSNAYPKASTIFKNVHICLMLEGRNLDDFGLRFFSASCSPTRFIIATFPEKMIKISRIFVKKNERNLFQNFDFESFTKMYFIKNGLD